MVYEVKGQGQLGTLYKTFWARYYMYYYSFCPITFKLNMKFVSDERRNPIDFVNMGHKVNFYTLPVKHCGYNEDYSLFLISFEHFENIKCKLLEETRTS